MLNCESVAGGVSPGKGKYHRGPWNEHHPPRPSCRTAEGTSGAGHSVRRVTVYLGLWLTWQGLSYLGKAAVAAFFYIRKCQRVLQSGYSILYIHWSSCSIFLPTFEVISLFNFSHYSGCEEGVKWYLIIVFCCNFQSHLNIFLFFLTQVYLFLPSAVLYLEYHS